MDAQEEEGVNEKEIKTHAGGKMDYECFNLIKWVYIIHKIFYFRLCKYGKLSFDQRFRKVITIINVLN